ncbi:MAG: hypothetical protein LBM98_05020 [Oscillospiraceae bacterium]|nr:hypothetical protein [Oscillospiraceae bacterium]
MDVRRAVRGETTPPPTAAPLLRGEFTRVGFRNPTPPSKPIPLLGGVPPTGGGVVSPRRARTQPPSKPPSLIFDIC